MHLDKATPHLHIDYIPIGHFSNGLDTRNAMAKALEEMRFGKGANAINRWRLAEWEVLHQICLAHGIEISEPQKSGGTLEVAEYKEQRQKADEPAVQNAQVETEIGEKCKMLKSVKERTAKLTEIDSAVRSFLGTCRLQEERGRKTALHP